MTVDWKSPDKRIRFWTEGAIAHLDVRELLLAGGKPYAPIMSCVAKLKGGDVLVVHAVIAPRPLQVQLEKRGMTCELRQEEPDHWVLVVKA